MECSAVKAVFELFEAECTIKVNIAAKGTGCFIRITSKNANAEIRLPKVRHITSGWESQKRSFVRFAEMSGIKEGEQNELERNQTIRRCDSWRND